MVTVPADIQNRVALRPLDATPLRAAEGFGQADQIIARTAENLGGDLKEAAQVEVRINEIYDDAAVARADAIAITRLQEARAAATAAQGFDAQAAVGTFRDQLGSIEREISGSLANPRQRQMFSNLYARRAVDDRNVVANHANTQVVAARREAGEARIGAALARAVDLRADPVAVASSRATLEAEVRAALPGQAEETVRGEIAKMTTRLHQSTAQAMTAPGGEGALAAQEYLDTHAAEILPDEETALRMRLQPLVDNEVVDAAASMVAERLAVPPPEGDEAPAAAPITLHTADPLRGRGRSPVAGGQYGAARGRRSHGGVDYPASEGTPIYPPAPGRVIQAWNDTEHGGGLSVIVEHADGRRTGYAHMRNMNVRAGQDISVDTVIGGVGNTGRSSGPHLHFTVRGADGSRLDPTAQTWGGPSGQAAPRARRVDLQSAFDTAAGVADELGLNGDQRRSLFARIDQEAARDERLLARQREDAADQAEDAIAEAEAAGRPIDPSSLPGYADLDPTKRRQIDRYIRNGEGRADSDEYFNLLEMSAANPQRFVQTDLSEYRGRISGNELARLRATQISIRHPGADRRGRGPSSAGTRPAVTLAALDRRIDLLMPSLGLDRGTGQRAQREARTNRARLVEVARDGVSRWLENNPNATTIPDDVLDHYIGAAARPVTVNGEQARRYEAVGPTGQTIPYTEDLSTIPVAVRREIEREFRAVRGRAPNPSETATMYSRRLYAPPR